MAPTPIASSTVSVALHYIAPPSQIDQPLPPFLLSKSLLQRHHFLRLSYDDPAEYLCWPADDSSTAVARLELLPTPQDDHAPPTYPTQYSSDGEDIYAHVALFPNDDDGVRLVFHWDDLDGWKFHDLKTMPFPQGSRPSLLQTLAAAAPPAAEEPEPQYKAHPAWNPYDHDHDRGGSGSDDDDYWNAYGQTDSAGGSPRQHALPLKDSTADSEDAYWAQYASVHGTADSTIPSPRDPRRRPPIPGVQIHDTQQPGDEVLTFSAYDQPARIPMIPADPYAPASPTVLAQRLADISPRRSPAPFFSELESSETKEFFEAKKFSEFGEYAVPGAFGEEDVQARGPEYGALELGLRSLGVGLGVDRDGTLSPPLDGSDDSDETASPPVEVDIVHREARGDGSGAPGLEEGLSDPLEQHAVDAPLAVRTLEKKIFSSLAGGDSQAEAVLRESAKGLYALWRSNTAHTMEAEEKQKEAFMRAIADAIDFSA